MIDPIVLNILKNKYEYKGAEDIYEIINFFKDKYNIQISAVKVCGPTDLTEHWNCFVEEISYPFGIYSAKRLFQDSWSLDFDYEEVLNLCIYYYFVDLGLIPLLGKDSN